MQLSTFVRLAGRWGGYRLARAFTAGQPRLLMYHRFSRSPKHGHVCAKTFEEQVALISRFYKPFTVSEMVERHYEGNDLPPHSIAITVDDGYKDFYDIAWPILKKYKVPATFYVTTGFIDGRLWLWPDQLKWLLRNAPTSTESVQLKGMKLTSSVADTGVDQFFEQLVALLLGMPDEEKHACLEELARNWSLKLPETAPADFQAASWAQLEELQAGGVEIGGHTVSHPSLGRVGLEQAEREIVGCSTELNEHLGVQPRTFCYPNGTPADFVGAQVSIVRDAGFTGAVVAFADAQGMGQRFAIRRHSSSEDMFQFNKAVSGIEWLGRVLRGRKDATAYELL